MPSIYNCALSCAFYADSAGLPAICLHGVNSQKQRETNTGSKMSKPRHNLCHCMGLRKIDHTAFNMHSADFL